MGKFKVIVSGVSWTIINNIFSIVYGIISVPFLIHYFGKEQYGLIGIALSANIYLQLLDMGMTNANVRYFSEYLAKKDKERTQTLFGLTYFIYFIIGLINTLVLFVVAFFVEDIFKISPDQVSVLRNLMLILALNSTFSWISVCFDQFLRANELIDWLKKFSTLLKGVQFVCLFLTIALHFSIELYFFCNIFALTIILPCAYAKTRRITPWLSIRPRFSKEMLMVILPYALSIFSFSIFQFFAFNSRPLLLGMLSGPSPVADFNIMNTIATVVTVLSGSFMQVLLPIMTKMKVNNDHEKISVIINSGTKYVCILLSMVIFLLILTNKEILSIYVGKEYLFLSPWITLWLATLLLSHRNVMTSLVFTETKLKSISIMGFIAMSVAFIIYFVLIPKYGVGGCVIGFTLHELIHTVFYYFYFFPVKFHINSLRIFSKSVLPVWITYLAICIATAYGLSGIVDSDLIAAIIKGAVFGVAAIIATWFILLNRKDKDMILSHLPFNKK